MPTHSSHCSTQQGACNQKRILGKSRGNLRCTDNQKQPGFLSCSAFSYQELLSFFWTADFYPKSDYSKGYLNNKEPWNNVTALQVSTSFFPSSPQKQPSNDPQSSGQWCSVMSFFLQSCNIALWKPEEPTPQEGYRNKARGSWTWQKTQLLNELTRDTSLTSPFFYSLLAFQIYSTAISWKIPVLWQWERVEKALQRFLCWPRLWHLPWDIQLQATDSQNIPSWKQLWA